ncbi:hypothetical protein HPB52_024751 [Rhipicephalus sanguineus]|uniref:Tr-type G domain-containing protein n=1 Tax=Rhipicephalus sanguineus TaxID=34632 RepID=A0A9D4YRR5_RHISA|nr:hypothetical protein HPB52_024751 [Rhipicephalus sanguineus]
MQETAKDEDQGPKKEHSNIGGQLLYLTDDRQANIGEVRAGSEEKNRESWYLSWALDTNQEGRDKGKTMEVGCAYFKTENEHFTMLDAPGHRSFVPNMIADACQADMAVLPRRLGSNLVILVNKMDDPRVEWSKERYNECKDTLVPYLRKCGFNPKQR